MEHLIRRSGAVGLLAAAVLLSMSCSLGWNLRQDPLYETFLEKTSLIMTEEEIDTYMHLPDLSSKREFIAEFWAMRDPDPGTEENEAKTEFERRVAFANRWFDPFGGCRGHVSQRRAGEPTGWNTDRGRVFIVMGLPDLVSIGTVGMWEPIGDDRGDLLCRALGWLYERYDYAAQFINPIVAPSDDTHPYAESEPNVRPVRSLSRVSTQTEAMNRAKLDWLSWEVRGWTGKPFRFKADYTDKGIRIRVPVDRLSFEASEDRLLARFEIRIHVYRQKQRAELLQDRRSFEFTEDDILARKYLDILVPYKAKSKGPHLFDIILGFETGQGVAKYRDYVKKTF